MIKNQQQDNKTICHNCRGGGWVPIKKREQLVKSGRRYNCYYCNGEGMRKRE